MSTHIEGIGLMLSCLPHSRKRNADPAHAKVDTHPGEDDKEGDYYVRSEDDDEIDRCISNNRPHKTGDLRHASGG